MAGLSKEIILCLERENSRIDAFFLGGSHAQGFGDEFSEYEFCIVFQTKEDLPVLINSLTTKFRSFDEYEKDRASILRLSFVEQNFQIRLVQRNQFEGVLGLLKSGQSLNYAEQVLLANIREGIYYYETSDFAKARSEIFYPPRLKREIIERYLPLLDCSPMYISVIREDFFHVLRIALTIREAVLALSYARREKFLESFKHEKKKRALLPKNAIEVLDALMDLSCRPTEEAFLKLKGLLSDFRIDFVAGLDDTKK